MKIAAGRQLIIKASAIVFRPQGVVALRLGRGSRQRGFRVRGALLPDSLDLSPSSWTEIGDHGFVARRFVELARCVVEIDHASENH